MTAPLALWAGLRGAARWVSHRAVSIACAALVAYAVIAAVLILYTMGRLWWWFLSSLWAVL